MFIVPLTSSITPMETMSQKKQTESTDDGEATFFDVFESLVKNVKETDAQVQKDSVDLMLGDVDDLAQIPGKSRKGGYRCGSACYCQEQGC